MILLLPPADVVCEGYIFTGVCDSVNGGACVVLFGGHAWFYPGGMRGFIRGGFAWFYLGGHAWFYSGGHAWFYSRGGMCGFIQGGVRGFSSFFGYNEIRSMSERYASYWNAFLLLILLTRNYQNVSRYPWNFVSFNFPVYIFVTVQKHMTQLIVSALG